MGLVTELVQTLVDLMDGPGGFVEAFVLLGLLWLPTVLIHEFGHLVAMLLVYGGPVEIRAGAGRPWLDARWGRIRLRISGIPGGGMAISGAPDWPGVTLRHHITVLLAGPGASLVSALLALALFEATAAGGIAHDVWWAAAGLGLWTAVFNLLPLEFESRSGERRDTDGSRIRRLLSIRRTGALPRHTPVVKETVSDEGLGRRLATIAVIGLGAVVLVAVLAASLDSAS